MTQETDNIQVNSTMAPNRSNHLMESALRNNQSSKILMESLMKKGVGVSIPKMGEVTEGLVLRKEGNRIYIDLGLKGIGIIYGKEYYIAQEYIKGLKEGDSVSVKIVDVDNFEGYSELSMKEAGEDKKWQKLKKYMNEGEVLEIAPKEANRGGLIIELEGISGFLPTSQLSPQNYPRVEGGDKEKIFHELKKLVAVPMKIKVLEANPFESKLIFSEKRQDSEEMREQLAKFKEGDVVKGEITGVVDFGAFMKIDDTPLEGLIHISEMDWVLIEDPRKIVKPGDRVEAKIIDIQGDRISLSLKALKPDPWLKIAEKFHKDDIIKARVSKLNPFGAFVQMQDDVLGLVHVSEFGDEEKMKQALEVGKEYQFKILVVEPKEHRISLSIVANISSE